MAFLGRLVEWGHSPDNAWHTCPSCLGWRLNPDRLDPIPTPQPGKPSCLQLSARACNDDRWHTQPSWQGWRLIPNRPEPIPTPQPGELFDWSLLLELRHVSCHYVQGLSQQQRCTQPSSCCTASWTGAQWSCKHACGATAE